MILLSVTLFDRYWFLAHEDSGPTRWLSHQARHSVDDDGSARLKEAALMLLLPFFDSRENPREKAFRLIGLRVEKLF